jgi:hypothetical protein
MNLAKMHHRELLYENSATGATYFHKLEHEQKIHRDGGTVNIRL